MLVAVTRDAQRDVIGKDSPQTATFVPPSPPPMLHAASPLHDVEIGKQV